MWLIHCHNKAAVHLYYFHPKVEYSVAMESQFIHQHRLRLNGTILISNIYKIFSELNNELFKCYCWPVWWRLIVFPNSWSYLQNNSLFLWPACRPDWKYQSISFNKWINVKYPTGSSRFLAFTQPGSKKKMFLQRCRANIPWADGYKTVCCRSNKASVVNTVTSQQRKQRFKIQLVKRSILYARNY